MVMYAVILTTVDSQDAAERIADEVLKNRLAACVQVIGPIRSKYWWKGSIESSEEYLILIKSRKNLYKEVEDLIREIHPYEIPEIIALPVEEGLEDYLKWMSTTLRRGKEAT